MKNKNVKILINLMLICLCLFFVFSTKVQADTKLVNKVPEASVNKWINEGNNFIKAGATANPINSNQIKNTVIPIGQALVAIATVVLVVVTVIMGIKYMMAKNDASERAKLKTQLIGLVISTIVIFGAQIIWSSLKDFMIELTA